MTFFWIAAALLLAAVLISLIAPLVAKRRASASARTDYDVAVYAEQLREVEKDIDRGLLDDTQAEAARTEIKRRLLAAAGQDVDVAAHQPGGMVAMNLILVIVLAVAVPAGALGLYRYLGSPHTPDMPLASRHDPAIQQAKRTNEMTRLVSELEQRLQDNPDDQKGWELLAKSYESMDRLADAAQAWSRVVQLSHRDPDALSAYGEALTFANKGQVTPVAVEVFQEALKKNPDDARSAYYLGFHAVQAGDFKKAYDIWTSLAERSAPDAPWMGVLKQQIARAAKQLGIATPLTAETPSVGPGPTEAQRKAAADMTPEQRKAMIQTMVQRLADKLKANPNDREGWLRLARAYQVLGETEKAQEALKKANALAGPTPSITTPPGNQSVAPPLSDAERAAVANMTPEQRNAMIRSMVQRLADKLKANPNDREGWLRLARAYQVLGETEKAKEALAKAQALK